MSRENYRRIVRGYEPIEPAGFFEKVFYLLWLLVCSRLYGYASDYIGPRMNNERTKQDGRSATRTVKGSWCDAA